VNTGVPEKVEVRAFMRFKIFRRSGVLGVQGMQDFRRCKNSM